MRSTRMRNLIFGFMVLLVAATTLSTDAGRIDGAKCDLKCKNGGVCKRRQLINEIRNYEISRLNQDISKQQQELEPQRHYCQCPTGYVGSMCEIKLVLCENGINGTCSNGNTCKRGIDGSNEEYYHCGCDVSKSDLSLPYADKFCTHESTVFCINEIDAKNIKKKRQSLGGGSRSSFCVNGGTCKDVITASGNHVSSCNCPSDFTGSHCEVSTKSKTQKASKYATNESSPSHHRSIFVTILVFFVCFFTIIAVSLTLLIWYGNRNRIPKKPKKSALHRATIPKQSDHTTATYVEVHTNDDV